jgi:hypothetical protein
MTVQCEARWRNQILPGNIKGQWCEEEDNKLASLISPKVPINWGKISSEMVGRSAKQCRERWINYLDPKNLRTRFSTEEDEKLLSLHAKVGNRWAQIARLMPGRSVSSDVFVVVVTALYLLTLFSWYHEYCY